MSWGCKISPDRCTTQTKRLAYSKRMEQNVTQIQRKSFNRHIIQFANILPFSSILWMFSFYNLRDGASKIKANSSFLCQNSSNLCSRLQNACFTNIDISQYKSFYNTLYFCDSSTNLNLTILHSFSYIFEINKNKQSTTILWHKN